MMNNDDIARAFKAGFDAAWDESGEGFNGEYTRPSFTRERYEAMRAEALLTFITATEVAP